MGGVLLPYSNAMTMHELLFQIQVVGFHNLPTLRQISVLGLDWFLTQKRSFVLIPFAFFLLGNFVAVGDFFLVGSKILLLVFAQFGRSFSVAFRIVGRYW